MSIKELLTGWTIPHQEHEEHIHAYSTIGDILAYQRCRRQYGHFHVRRFSTSTDTQRYFGVLVHDVLDRINRNYHLVPTLPARSEVETLVTQAHDRLVRSGVRPYNSIQQQADAAKLIHRFVELIGPHFFPNVQQTEYRLERALQTPSGRDYILDGVVDVLAGAVSHSLGLPTYTTATDVEIWDYKSGQRPKKGTPELQSYEYQMQVYAELYRQQTGDYPERCVLVFVGELRDDAEWSVSKASAARYPDLIYTIHPLQKHVTAAMTDFHATVEAIEAERAKPYGAQWHPPPPHTVPEQTCTACDLRFNCDGYPQGRKQRSEAL